MTLLVSISPHIKADSNCGLTDNSSIRGLCLSESLLQEIAKNATRIADGIKILLFI
jgi:hypothetical protein